MVTPYSRWKILEVLDIWTRKCTNISPGTTSLFNCWYTIDAISLFSALCTSQAPPTSNPQRQNTRPSPIPSPNSAPTPPPTQTAQYYTEVVRKNRYIFAWYTDMFLGLGANCFKEPVTQLFSLFFTSLISLFSSYVFLVTLLFIIFFNRYCINFIIIVFVFVGKSFFLPLVLSSYYLPKW